MAAPTKLISVLVLTAIRVQISFKGVNPTIFSPRSLPSYLFIATGVNQTLKLPKVILRNSHTSWRGTATFHKATCCCLHSTYTSSLHHVSPVLSEKTRTQTKREMSWLIAYDAVALCLICKCLFNTLKFVCISDHVKVYYYAVLTHVQLKCFHYTASRLNCPVLNSCVVYGLVLCIQYFLTVVCCSFKLNVALCPGETTFHSSCLWWEGMTIKLTLIITHHFAPSEKSN